MLYHIHVSYIEPYHTNNITCHSHAIAKECLMMLCYNIIWFLKQIDTYL